MTKVKITEEEWYPMYEIDLDEVYANNKNVGASLEVPGKKINEYKAIMKKFTQMQNYLETLYDNRFNKGSTIK